MKNEIIIIGAGLAGLSASLSAVQSGASVTLVSSHPSERAQSVMAEGGINAALNTKGEDDTPEEHYQDTLKAGCYLADPNAVRGLTSEAPSIVKWLLELGVQFNMQKDGRIDLRNFGGQKKKRTAFAQSDSGKQIMTALIDAVRKQESLGKIKRLPHHRFRTLLISGDTCYGCVLEDTYSGEILEIKADAVIVATGGMHGLFANTTGSLINTGAVAAELFRLGIPMANLEMIQYHPTTAKSNGKRILITEAARGEGASLFSIHDKEKCYFMKEKYPELGDLMPRDITAREIYSEMKTSDVFLDMTIIPEKTVSEKLSGIAADCQLYLHKDICKEPVQVAPGIHYFMGGIKVDVCHRTAIKSLYAAGECCAQYHGANRLGGNSLLGAIYGGRVAGKHACIDETAADGASGGKTVAGANEGKNVFGRNKDRIAESSKTSNTADIISSREADEKLGEILAEALGVIRNEETMEKGLHELEGRKDSFSLLGKACIMSAIARKESRGAHYREDYPETNDKDFRKITVAVFKDGEIKITFEEIPAI